MNKEDSLKLAKDKLKHINEEIRELSNVLDRTGYEYEIDLEIIDYSTTGDKKIHNKLNVVLKQNLPDCVVRK
ncbi:MAG: hypothetical protein OSJ63_07710 [Bacilli bacterium]|nr:hypothetical protein [Bacilli bacterium]